MSTLQHTPSPWILDPENKRELIDERYHFIKAGLGFSDPDPDINTGFTIAGYFSKPDATLIAAAPDLLEALMEIVATAGDRNSTINMFNAVRKAEVAIAKATEGGKRNG